MDDLSFELAIALQLEDIGGALASRKGKGKQGDAAASSDEIAFNDYRNHLLESARIILDERLAESLDKAVRSDGELLEQISRMELIDESDRKLALSLSGNPAPTTGVTTDHIWRNMAVGSGAEISDSAIAEWEQRCHEWDAFDSKPAAGPSVSHELRRRGVDCVVCLERFLREQTINAPCSHSYCRADMKDLFTRACKDEELFPPRCCRKEIPLETALLLLTDQEASEYLEKVEEYTTKDRTYCFQPSCSRFIPSDNISRDIANCDSCLAQTCTLCKGRRHHGDCPDDPNMKLTLETAAANGWQRCQQCHALVERAYGCQHMTCRCGAEWCYRCAVAWKGCVCGDWDDGQLRRRAEDLAIREVGANADARVLAGRVEVISGDLRVNHECAHMSGWTRHSGGATCEMCSSFLPDYIFVCIGCRLRACNRCHINRV